MALNVPNSMPLGSILGIPVRLHFFFLVILLSQVLSASYQGPQIMLLWFILLGPVLLLTILVHELGHCLAARSVGSEVHGVLLWPLGGLAFIGYAPSPKADMWVAVAGPLTHVPMVLLWLLVLLPASHAASGSWHISLAMPWPDAAHLLQAVCVGAIIMNLSLCAFNLLVPAYPLDGGRILVDCLLTWGASEATTAKVAVGLATPVALMLVICGGMQGQVVTMMVGAWILYSTFQLFQAIRHGNISHHPMFACCSESGTDEETQYLRFGTEKV